MFTLKIATDNDAFGGHPDSAREVARILYDVITRIQDGGLSGGLRDVNGNTVGEFHFDVD